VALITAEGFKDAVEAESQGVNVGVILDRTNFYAEQGGQIYDTGQCGRMPQLLSPMEPFRNVLVHLVSASCRKL
jgi:alanyl-tRNA synthetase